MKLYCTDQVHLKVFCTCKKQDMFSYPENLVNPPFANAHSAVNASRVDLYKSSLQPWNSLK